FCDHFVGALDGKGDQHGDPDFNNDGYVTGEELGRFLSEHVSKETNNKQTPRFGKIGNDKLNLGDIVFQLAGLQRHDPSETKAQSIKGRIGSAGVPLHMFCFETVSFNQNSTLSERRQKQVWGFEEDLGHGMKLEMVEIEGGSFM